MALIERDREPVRLAVTLSPETADALRRYAERRDIGDTEAARRIIGLCTILDEAHHRGDSVYVQSRKTAGMKEIILD